MFNSYEGVIEVEIKIVLWGNNVLNLNQNVYKDIKIKVSWL